VTLYAILWCALSLFTHHIAYDNSSFIPKLSTQFLVCSCESLDQIITTQNIAVPSTLLLVRSRYSLDLALIVGVAEVRY
jgi:hypothetical protein